MAGRHLKYMESIFGLDGKDSGHVMAKRFNKFRDMFEYWLDKMGEPSQADRRLHVMLTGLLDAIDNGFRNDPICVSNLAKQLQQKYGQKNIRDTKAPLEELFSEETLSSYLVLYEDDDDCYRIGKQYDPLLLRWRSRNEVGDNHDISINLAIPGRVHSIFEEHLIHLNPQQQESARVIANAVTQSLIWKNEGDEQVIPTIFYREGEDGPLMLTLFHPQNGEYMDIRFDLIESIPDNAEVPFVPYDMPLNLWMQFRQLAG